MNFVREYERVQRKDRDANYVKANFFVGYVSGLTAAIDDTEACLPSSTTNDTAAAVVAKYLNDHPEQWPQVASRIMRRALVTAFPCKK